MTKQTTEKAFLKNYDIHDFDVPLTTVDMSIFTIRDNCLQVLLVKRAQHPSAGMWALPGGFIDLRKDNNLGATARRKLKEKTGIDTPYLEQVETFGSAKRDPRGWSVTIAYLALIASNDIQLSRDDSSEEVTWVAIEDALHNFKLAFDHKAVLQTCFERLKNNRFHLNGTAENI